MKYEVCAVYDVLFWILLLAINSNSNCDTSDTLSSPGGKCTWPSFTIVVRYSESVKVKVARSKRFDER